MSLPLLPEHRTEAVAGLHRGMEEARARGDHAYAEQIRPVLADALEDAGADLESKAHRYLAAPQDDRWEHRETVLDAVRHDPNPHEAAFRLSHLAHGLTQQTGHGSAILASTSALDAAHGADYRRNHPDLSARHHAEAGRQHWSAGYTHDIVGGDRGQTNGPYQLRHQLAGRAHHLAHDAHGIAMDSSPG